MEKPVFGNGLFSLKDSQIIGQSFLIFPASPPRRNKAKIAQIAHT